MLAQQADQLGDDHARVGIVDLDGGVVGQVVIVAAAGGTLGQNQLRTGGNHQVLLVDAQAAARLVAVVRVQKQRQVFVDVGLVELNAVMDDRLINRVEVKQVQRVGAALVAGHGQLIQPGGVLLARQADRVGHVGFFGPAVGSQPGVGQLVLHAARERLMEQPEVIPQADAVTGQVQRGERVEEAGGKTPQSAVAQARLRLDLLNVRKALARSGQRGAGVVVQPQVDEVVGQQLADQELGADVVQLAAGHGLHAGGALLTHDVQQGEVDLLVGAGSQRLGGLGFDSSGHIHNGYLPIIYFLLRFAGTLMVYHKSASDSCAIGANCGTILS